MINNPTISDIYNCIAITERMTTRDESFTMVTRIPRTKSQLTIDRTERKGYPSFNQVKELFNSTK